jgi:hypothetical protein
MKVKTIFVSSEKSEHDSELQVYATDDGELLISIYSPGEELYAQWVSLDKQTAIKFSKIVRREISFLKDEEVGNG